MKTLIIDAASIDSMYTIHDRFIAAFDFARPWIRCTITSVR